MFSIAPMEAMALCWEGIYPTSIAKKQLYHDENEFE